MDTLEVKKDLELILKQELIALIPYSLKKHMKSSNQQ